ncbi:MAG: hypothetical protein H6747_07925 [Deltaproteobacteria bacterium]|nr:hypothetical protein [Deltaproteobacteria bacterium]
MAETFRTRKRSADRQPSLTSVIHSGSRSSARRHHRSRIEISLIALTGTFALLSCRSIELPSAGQQAQGSSDATSEKAIDAHGEISSDAATDAAAPDSSELVDAQHDTAADANVQDAPDVIADTTQPPEDSKVAELKDSQIIDAPDANTPADAASDATATADGSSIDQGDGDASSPPDALATDATADAGSPPTDSAPMCIAAACDDGNTCTFDYCAISGACVSTPLDSLDCDDGDKCTSGDVCINGSCKSGPPKLCKDGDVCTKDSCAAGSGECMHVVTDGCVKQPCVATADCAKGLICDTSKHVCVGCLAHDDCGAQQVCAQGSCTPGQTCASTVECKALGGVCSTAKGVCVDCNSAAECQAGQACLDNACVAKQLCSSDKDCPAVCGKGLGYCVACNANADCLDGGVCGADRQCHPPLCVANACVSGAHLVCTSGSVGYFAEGCDDGNVCTNDSCTPATGCAHSALVGPCDDGLACTVGDACSPLGCVAGKPQDCNDGNDCTVDSCDPGSGACSYTNLKDLTECGAGGSGSCVAGSCKVSYVSLDASDGQYVAATAAGAIVTWGKNSHGLRTLSLKTPSMFGGPEVIAKIPGTIAVRVVCNSVCAITTNKELHCDLGQPITKFNVVSGIVGFSSSNEFVFEAGGQPKVNPVCKPSNGSSQWHVHLLMNLSALSDLVDVARAPADGSGSTHVLGITTGGKVVRAHVYEGASKLTTLNTGAGAKRFARNGNTYGPPIVFSNGSTLDPTSMKPVDGPQLPPETVDWRPGSSGCLRTSAGDAWCVGSNGDGLLGALGGSSKAYVKVASTGKCIAMGTTLGSACCLDDQGVIRCWGSNRYGQLGDSKAMAQMPVVAVNQGSGKSASGLYRATTPGLWWVLDQNGDAITWGHPASQTDLGASKVQSPVPTASMNDITALGVRPAGDGGTFCYAVRDNKLVAWQGGGGSLVCMAVPPDSSASTSFGAVKRLAGSRALDPSGALWWLVDSKGSKTCKIADGVADFSPTAILRTSGAVASGFGDKSCNACGSDQYGCSCPEYCWKDIPILDQGITEIVEAHWPWTSGGAAGILAGRGDGKVFAWFNDKVTAVGLSAGYISLAWGHVPLIRLTTGVWTLGAGLGPSASSDKFPGVPPGLDDPNAAIASLVSVNASNSDVGCGISDQGVVMCWGANSSGLARGTAYRASPGLIAQIK